MFWRRVEKARAFVVKKCRRLLAGFEEASAGGGSGYKK